MMWRAASNTSAPACVRQVTLAALLACLLSTAQVEAGGIRGYVFGLNAEGAFDRPIQGATVEFLDAGGTVVAQATTNAAGYYQVELDPGVYRYRVSAPGYGSDDDGRQISVQFTDRYALRNFALKRGEDRPRREKPSTEEKPAILMGHVFEDRDGRPIGVPGVRIVLKGPAGTYQVFTSGSSQDDPGVYRIVLPPGTYAAAALAAGYAPATAEGIELRAGQTTEHNFVLRRLKQDTGRLTITPRIEPPSSQPLPGKVQMWVRSLDRTNWVLGPLEGSLGSSASVQLPPGRYLVLGHAGEGRYRGQAGPVAVGSGETAALELVLTHAAAQKEPASLVVHVIDEASRPVPGVRVLVRRPDQSLRTANSAVTDPQGQATFAQLEPGAYQVLAQKEGYRPEGRTVELASGETEAVRLLLQPASGATQQRLAKVTGYVVYPSERSETGYFGVAGARIEWRPLGAQGRTVTVATERTGRYELSLPVGKYMVRVIPSGERFGAVQEIVEVPPGEFKKFFVLGRSGPVAEGLVTVRGLVGVRTATALGRLGPVAGVRVRFQPTTPQLDRSATAVSDSRGSFQVQLPPGDYVVSVVPPPGYNPRQLRVRVAPGMGPLVIELTTAGASGPGGEGEVAVVEVVQAVGPLLPAFMPVPGATVRIYAQGRPVATGRTDPSGRFQAMLPNGFYRVVAEAGGLTGTASLVVRNGGRVQVVLRRQPGEIPGGGPGQPGAGGTPVTIEVVTPQLSGEIRKLVPVGGATVLFRTGGEIVQRGMTGKEGRYITRLSPGRYLVVVRHPRLGGVTVNIVVGTRPVTRRVVLQGTLTGPTRLPRAPMPQ